jgi:hypothetical protein
VQGVDGHQFGAGGLQRGQVVGVVEAEGAVAGDADAQVGPAGRCARAERRPRRPGGGQAPHGGQVHLRADDAADGLHAFARVVHLGAGHQAQVALGHRQRGSSATAPSTGTSV